MASDTWQMTPHFGSFEFERRDSVSCPASPGPPTQLESQSLLATLAFQLMGLRSGFFLQVSTLFIFPMCSPWMGQLLCPHPLFTRLGGVFPGSAEGAILEVGESLLSGICGRQIPISWLLFLRACLPLVSSSFCHGQGFSSTEPLKLLSQAAMQGGGGGGAQEFYWVVFWSLLTAEDWSRMVPWRHVRASPIWSKSEL